MDKDEKGKLFDFFATEGKKLIGYVHRKVRSISDMEAEDIVGEVMLNILNKVIISDCIDNLPAYVYRSLHNTMIDHHRRNMSTISLQNCMDEDGEITLMELLSDSTSNVSNVAEKNEFMRRLAQAIGRLEPKQRAIFIATEIDGKTFRYLSEQWQEPIGTLLSRKCRAMKALQETLKDLKPE